MGFSPEDGTHLDMQVDLVPEMAMLAVLGYFVDSQGKNLLPLLERTIMARIRKFLKRAAGNGDAPPGGDSKLPS